MKEKKKGEANDSKEGTNKKRAIEIIAVKGQRKADAKDESCVDNVAEVHPNISDDKCNHAYSRERLVRLFTFKKIYNLLNSQNQRLVTKITEKFDKIRVKVDNSNFRRYFIETSKNSHKFARKF